MPGRKELTITRELTKEMERYEKYLVKMTIENKSSFDCIIRIKDSFPVSFQTTFPENQSIPKLQKTMLSYEIKPLIRGKYTIDKLYTRYRSKIGLWERQLTFNQKDELKVIPNLSETKKYLASAQNYLLHEGIKIRKMKSGMGEFSKVRSYVVGDDPRKMNWRQSAKLQEMMTNEYEPEHGKNLTILIDCGRMMGVELEEGNRLEKSIEAAITLATAALDNGDHVSVIAFSKDIKTVIPSGKGLDHLNTILQGIYSLQVDPQESNYELAIRYIQSVQNKRSMIILFSDIQTFIHEDHHLFYLKELRRKHLFLMLGIKDLLLHQKIEKKPTTVKLAMEKSVAQKQYLLQKKGMRKWEKHGLPMLESPAEDLAVTAVSQYIDTLNRGLL